MVSQIFCLNRGWGFKHGLICIAVFIGGIYQFDCLSSVSMCFMHSFYTCGGPQLWWRWSVSWRGVLASTVFISVSGPSVWCVMVGGEGCRVVNQVLFAFQQNPNQQEELFECLSRLQSGYAQTSSPLIGSCDIFVSFSDLVDENSHELAVLLTHSFEFFDLKAACLACRLACFSCGRLLLIVGFDALKVETLRDSSMVCGCAESFACEFR